jgi:hypothetical protein
MSGFDLESRSDLKGRFRPNKLRDLRLRLGYYYTPRREYNIERNNTLILRLM